MASSQDAPAPYFSTADLGALQFEPVTRHGKLYVSNLASPLVVSTPPVRLSGPLTDDAPFVFLRPTGKFSTWLRDVEDRVLEACLANKADWFPKPLDDDALRHNFKSFFRGDEFKVRREAVAVFDEHGNAVGVEEAGDHVRCVLELHRVCFGRQEFGAMWRLVQAQAVTVPSCLIEVPCEEAGEEGDDAEGEGLPEGPDVDEAEFL
jgi:hypothetical protein